MVESIRGARVLLDAWLVRLRLRLSSLAGDRGQTVAEYALVLLVAAVIAGSLIVWAKQSGKLDSFFDAIFAKLLESVEPAPSPTPSPAP